MSLLGIASLEKFAILTLKTRSHVRILIYRTWAISITTTKIMFTNELMISTETSIGEVSLSIATLT